MNKEPVMPVSLLRLLPVTRAANGFDTRIDPQLVMAQYGVE